MKCWNPSKEISPQTVYFRLVKWQGTSGEFSSHAELAGLLHFLKDLLTLFDFRDRQQQNIFPIEYLFTSSRPMNILSWGLFSYKKAALWWQMINWLTSAVSPGITLIFLFLNGNGVAVSLPVSSQWDLDVKHSDVHVSSSITECKPEHLRNFRSVVPANVYISPKYPHDSYQDFLQFSRNFRGKWILPHLISSLSASDPHQFGYSSPLLTPLALNNSTRVRIYFLD